MSVRRRLVAGSGRPTLVCSLGLLAAAVAVLLLPAFACAFLSGDSGACLCQSPQPPGDSLAVVACFDVSHGWLACGFTLLATACGLGAVEYRRVDSPRPTLHGRFRRPASSAERLGSLASF